MLDCQTYREMIAAHIDGALSCEEKLAAQTHLKECPKCTQMFLWETKAKVSLKPKLSLFPARPVLRERLLEQLEETRKGNLFGWFYTPQAAAAFALLLIFAIPYLIWRGRVHEDIFSDVIAQYQKVTHGTVELSQAFSSLTPGARLLDLSPWGYHVLARQTKQLKGREGGVFVYQGPAKEFLVAQEFEGVDIAPPPGARTIRASNRDFVSYNQQGVNMIAWKEKNKDLLCILVSTLSKEKLLSLAQQITTGS